MSTDGCFIPAFEGEWEHQSFLVQPTADQNGAKPGKAIDCKKWAMGDLTLTDGPEFTAAGKLVFAPGVELQVSVSFEPGAKGQPAKFMATGTAHHGPIKGASYELTGWVAPEASGQASRVEGGIRLTKGMDADPSKGPGGAPVGTVGSFRLERVPAQD